MGDATQALAEEIRFWQEQLERRRASATPLERERLELALALAEYRLARLAQTDRRH